MILYGHYWGTYIGNVFDDDNKIITNFTTFNSYANTLAKNCLIIRFDNDSYNDIVDMINNVAGVQKLYYFGFHVGTIGAGGDINNFPLHFQQDTDNLLALASAIPLDGTGYIIVFENDEGEFTLDEEEESMADVLYTGCFAAGDARYFMRKQMPDTTTEAEATEWFKNLSKHNHVAVNPGPVEGKCISVMKGIFYDDSSIPVSDVDLEFTSKLLISTNDGKAEQIRIPYCKADFAAAWLNANFAAVTDAKYMIGGSAV